MLGKPEHRQRKRHFKDTAAIKYAGIKCEKSVKIGLNQFFFVPLSQKTAYSDTALPVFRKMYRRLLILLIPLLLWSCSKDDAAVDTSLYSTTEWQEYKLAVIVPLSESKEFGERMHRIVDWFSENFHEGQKRCEKGVKFDVEWYDESSMTEDDIAQLAREFAQRDDLAAIVGPIFSTHLEIMASKVYRAGIPLIAPSATSDELQRKYSVTTTGKVKTPFLWCISPSDVTLSQLLLNNVLGSTYDPAHSERVPSVCLISSDDIYGKTFYEWLPFQATGMGIEMKLNQTYHVGKETEVRDCMNAAFACNPDYIICAAGSFQDAKQFARENYELCKKYSQEGKGTPKMFYTDTAYSSTFLEDPETVESAQGSTVYDDPQSGFRYTYLGRFGIMPMPDECMLYDALLLAGIACNVSLQSDEDNLNTIIQEISTGSGGYQNWEILDCPNWNATGIAQYLESYSRSKKNTYRKDTPSLFGVTGLLCFDYTAATTRSTSYYSIWKIVDGQFVTIDCVYGSRYESLSKWKSISFISDIKQQFNENISKEYGPWKDRWALLVCSSNEWSNYRHASDVLFIYQKLKAIGYDDKHIVLVFDDVYSQNPRNIFPGTIFHSNDTTFYGNLLKDVTVDYHIADLTPGDICDIMLGRKSEHLPTVLDTDSTSNVFFYWTGHGYDGGFVWNNAGDFTSDHLRKVVSQMSREKRFRKMLICAEPCHSGSVIKAIDGIPGVLGIASSYATESSFADDYDYEMEVWMNDRFSSVLAQSFIIEYTYQELYQNLWENTLGSHVNVVNADNFANLYTESTLDILGHYHE